MNPAVAKILINMANQAVFDEEFRNRLILIILTPVLVLIFLLALPFYLLSHPLEALGLVSADEIMLVTQLQDDFGYIGDDAVIDLGDDVVIDIDPDGGYSESQIPLFLQWDKRWGNFPYGKSGTIGSSGCGPTSLAMIVVGLIGDTAVNPKVVADWSVANGHRVEGQGSAWSLFPNGAVRFGINCTEIGVNSTAITGALREGKPLITSMAPGHFTREGHFIVLRGITESGKILVNDPNSVERTNKEWDIQIIVKEARGAWKFHR